MLHGDDLRTLLAQAHSRFGPRRFLIDDQWLGAVSYTDLWHFSLGVERHLDALGVPIGAPVATMFHNCGLAALLFLSVMASRRLLVPVNPISTQYELDYLLEKVNAAVILVDPTQALTGEYGDRPACLITDHRNYFVERCEESARAGKSDSNTTRESTFTGEVVFTSGSTGHPKGVVLSEASLIANARSLATVYELRSSDRFLTICPLFHNSGQVFTTLACMLVGGSTVAVKSAAGMLHFWSFVDKYRPHWSLGMVSFLALLLSKPEAPREHSQMRGLLTGGSVIDGGMIQRFESRFRVPVRSIYGLTETASISTCEFLDPNPRSYGSSGRPLPNCRIRIIPEGKALTLDDQLAPQEGGEIFISGPNVFDHYIGDPEATKKRKVDGWVRTGDYGYLDDRGNLFVIDRLDSMIIVGGENVYPAEIEKLCTFLPGAEQIVLVGIDHPIWGKELVLVYTSEISQPPSIRLWKRILGEHIAAIKIPQQYVSVRDLGIDDFPRKSNGKLDRLALATLVASTSYFRLSNA